MGFSQREAIEGKGTRWWAKDGKMSSQLHENTHPIHKNALGFTGTFYAPHIMFFELSSLHFFIALLAHYDHCPW
jgi:hypothetical protein